MACSKKTSAQFMYALLLCILGIAYVYFGLHRYNDIGIKEMSIIHEALSSVCEKYGITVRYCGPLSVITSGSESNRENQTYTWSLFINLHDIGDTKSISKYYTIKVLVSLYPTDSVCSVKLYGNTYYLRLVRVHPFTDSGYCFLGIPKDHLLYGKVIESIFETLQIESEQVASTWCVNN